jgi:hypothetical protein
MPDPPGALPSLPLFIIQKNHLLDRAYPDREQDSRSLAFDALFSKWKGAFHNEKKCTRLDAWKADGPEGRWTITASYLLITKICIDRLP